MLVISYVPICCIIFPFQSPLSLHKYRYKDKAIEVGTLLFGSITFGTRNVKLYNAVRKEKRKD